MTYSTQTPTNASSNITNNNTMETTLAHQSLLTQQRLNKTKEMLQDASQTNLRSATQEVIRLSEQHLQHVCAVIKVFQQDFASQHQHQQPTQLKNPFTTYLSQSRHRWAQVSLLLGNLEFGCSLFLQVIMEDPTSLSPSALAMTWYDIALVYLHYHKHTHCQAALNEAILIIRNKPRDANASGIFIDCPNGRRIGPDETMLFFIHQVLLRLRDATTTPVTAPRTQKLPWSVQFTTITYNYADDDAEEEDSDMDCFDEEDCDSDDEYAEDTEGLMDPSIRAAGAA